MPQVLLIFANSKLCQGSKRTGRLCAADPREFCEGKRASEVEALPACAQAKNRLGEVRLADKRSHFWGRPLLHHSNRLPLHEASLPPPLSKAGACCSPLQQSSVAD